MKMGHLQNIQSLETSIETGNLQSYDEQSIDLAGSIYYFPKKFPGLNFSLTLTLFLQLPDFTLTFLYRFQIP